MDGDPAPPEKRSEITMLRVVVVCLVVLYIVLAGYLIYSNQNLGTTQLGYSSLLASQSGKLQDTVAQLLTTVGQMQEDDLGRAALLNSRLKQLEQQTLLLSKALDTVEKTRQQTAQNFSGDLAKLREQLTSLHSELSALKTDQKGAAASFQTGVGQLQTSLAQSVASAAAQRDQLLTGVRSDLAQLREELGQASKTITAQSQLALLARLADEAATRARTVTQITPANATEAHQLWVHTRLLAAATATAPELATRCKDLTTLAADLGKRLAVAVTVEIARYERLAAEAKDAAAATEAWTKAGDWLRSYPVSEDPAVMDRLRELVLAHEAVRQKLAGPAKN